MTAWFLIIAESAETIPEGHRQGAALLIAETSSWRRSKSARNQLTSQRLVQ
jgi:hypothetical protein